MVRIHPPQYCPTLGPATTFVVGPFRYDSPAVTVCATGAVLLVGAAVMAHRLPLRALWILVAALLAGDIFGGIAMRALREFGKLPPRTGPPSTAGSWVVDSVTVVIPQTEWVASDSVAVPPPPRPR